MGRSRVRYSVTFIRRSMRSRWLRITIVLGVCFAWALVLYQQMPMLKPHLNLIQPTFLVAAIVWGTLYFVGLGFCWAVVLQHMLGAANRLSLVLSIHIWLRSMLTRYVPGNVWHIVGRVVLATQHNVPSALVIASATIEQVLMLLAALILCAVTLPFWSAQPTAQGWLLLLVPFGLGCLHPKLLNRVFMTANRLLKRPALVFHHTYRDIFIYLLLYVLAMLCAGFALLTLVGSLTPVSLAAVPFILGAAALAWAVGFLSFLTPSGLGVREAVLVALLVQQYPLPLAVAASLVFRLVLTVGEMLAVLLSYGLSRFRQIWVTLK